MYGILPLPAIAHDLEAIIFEGYFRAPSLLRARCGPRSGIELAWSIGVYFSRTFSLRPSNVTAAHPRWLGALAMKAPRLSRVSNCWAGSLPLLISGSRAASVSRYLLHYLGGLICPALERAIIGLEARELPAVATLLKVS